MSRYEIGVQVRQDYVRNSQCMFAGKLHVPVDVSLRIHYHRDARLLVSNQVRGMGQTIQVELLEDHERLQGAAFSMGAAVRSAWRNVQNRSKRRRLERAFGRPLVHNFENAPASRKLVGCQSR